MIACIFYDSDGIRSFEPFSRLLFNLFFSGYFLTGSSSGSSVRFFTALQLL